jgi:hypothetical protein
VAPVACPLTGRNGYAGGSGVSWARLFHSSSYKLLDVGAYVFLYANNATIYYLPGTMGWGATFADRPAVLWTPRIESSDAPFDVRTNQFGFNISWASDLVTVVEACANLTNPTWAPVGTNTLAGGSSYFSDPEWTNHPVRFYRLRSP